MVEEEPEGGLGNPGKRPPVCRGIGQAHRNAAEKRDRSKQDDIFRRRETIPRNSFCLGIKIAHVQLTYCRNQHTAVTEAG
ncbi:MAG: hypothetical protein AB4042_08345 [Leptolyngbyaceae cyanobacterium]